MNVTDHITGETGLETVGSIRGVGVIFLQSPRPLFSMQAKKDGELPKGTDARVLARFYSAVVQGMSVQARDGATRAELLKLADVALQAWPAKKKAS